MKKFLLPLVTCSALLFGNVNAYACWNNIGCNLGAQIINQTQTPYKFTMDASCGNPVTPGALGWAGNFSSIFTLNGSPDGSSAEYEDSHSEVQDTTDCLEFAVTLASDPTNTRLASIIINYNGLPQYQTPTSTFNIPLIGTPPFIITCEDIGNTWSSRNDTGKCEIDPKPPML